MRSFLPQDLCTCHILCLDLSIHMASSTCHSAQISSERLSPGPLPYITAPSLLSHLDLFFSRYLSMCINWLSCLRSTCPLASRIHLCSQGISNTCANVFVVVVVVFLGPHIEVPRLGVSTGLWLPAYATAAAMQDPCVCDIHHSSWQHRILNLLSGARDQTTCSFMATSQVHYL